MTPLTPYLVAGGLLVTVATGVGGYFFGKDVERDRAAVELAKERDARETASRADERLLSTVTGNLNLALTTALNQGDRQAAPIIVGMRDAVRSTPLATDPRCAVSVGVRDGAEALHRAAERAADAADTAGRAVVGGAQPAADR